jgi:hypothetical protein
MKAFEVTAETALEPLAVPSAYPYRPGGTQSPLFFLPVVQLLEHYHTDLGQEPSL